MVKKPKTKQKLSLRTDKIKVGIIGVGMVGGALARYFESTGDKPFLYDKFKKIGSPEEVNKADIIFICVWTPCKEGRGCDLSAVYDSFKSIKGKKIVVIKSTVLPGTTEMFQKKYPRHKVLFSPEFLRAASAYEDTCCPERQIVGYTPKSRSVAKRILEILPPAPFEKIISATEAEVVKYFGNTYLTLRVIFANQMYDICQSVKADYDNVKECVGADSRIGPSHLNVWQGGYRGYGATCFPKDIRALIKFAENKGMDLKLHRIVEQINQELAKSQGIDDVEKLKP